MISSPACTRGLVACAATTSAAVEQNMLCVYLLYCVCVVFVASLTRFSIRCGFPRQAQRKRWQCYINAENIWSFLLFSSKYCLYCTIDCGSSYNFLYLSLPFLSYHDHGMVTCFPTTRYILFSSFWSSFVRLEWICWVKSFVSFFCSVIMNFHFWAHVNIFSQAKLL